MNKTISILGTGWLGLPLGKKLLDQGYSVKGSTTTKENLKLLSEVGIVPFNIELKEHNIDGDILEFLKDTETLVMAFPPRLRKQPELNYASKIAHFMSVLKESDVKNLLYVSTTSVFEDEEADEDGFKVITEETEPNGISKKARKLIEGETLVKQAKEFNTTIVRFGGLIGGDRHPAISLSGKTDLKNPEAPVNLIHQEDAVNILNLIINKGIFGETFHAVNPIHQTRKNYYQFKAEAMDLVKPQFDEESVSKGKVIYSQKLNTLLGFEFNKEL
ncbi:NAD(P)H-binding protein [Croceibacter atlanticus]|uniref:NAD(P)H-binding protein n=1 Tax=Croceibacter atlanticus TaxID=313588 RepID=UPI0030FC1798